MSKEQKKKLQLKKGDVLLTKDSETWDDIAIPAYVPNDLENVVCGYHLAHLRPYSEKLIGAYLFRAISASGLREQFWIAANGVIRFGISKSSIADALFLVPPIAEQEAIASYLDQETTNTDTLIAAKQRLIALLKEKRTALISHVVTKGLNPNVALKDSGIEWLGAIPQHWQVKKIKYLTEILRGKFTHRPRNDPRFYDGIYPFIQTGDISNTNKYITTYQQTLNELGLSVSKEFPRGTLVMSIAANIGDLAILDFAACFPDSIVGFVPKEKNNLNYLYYNFIAMKSEMMKTATLNTQLNLNVERIKNLFTVLPPIAEQEAIASYLDKEISFIDSLIEKNTRSIELLKEHRTALISAAVTGKIDVRETSPQ